MSCRGWQLCLHQPQVNQADCGQPCFLLANCLPSFVMSAHAINFGYSWSQHCKVHLCSQCLAGCNVGATRAVCFADVPSCLGGSNPTDSVGSFKPSAGLHPSQWCNLVAAACVNATQLLTNSSKWHERTAVSTSQHYMSKLEHEQDTLKRGSLGDDSHHSEQRHAVYMLPVQLLRHTWTVKQNIDADTWQMLWCLYATEDVLPSESHLFTVQAACATSPWPIGCLSVSTCVLVLKCSSIASVCSLA